MTEIRCEECGLEWPNHGWDCSAKGAAEDIAISEVAASVPPKACPDCGARVLERHEENCSILAARRAEAFATLHIVGRAVPGCECAECRARRDDPVDPNISLARTTAGELAAQISDIVGERGSNYGPPEINFANIAAFWSAWVQARYGIMIPFDGADVGQMSSLIKVARLAQTPTHRDSALDGAIYTLLGFGCSLAAEKPK